MNAAGRVVSRIGVVVLLTAALALTASVATGCAGEDEAMMNGSSFDRATQEARAGYPAGPYGTGENAVITDIQFSGLTLSQLHADGGNRLLLLSTAAGWCTACIEEQPKLEERYQQWYNAGLSVVVTYFEDSNFGPATDELAAGWKNQYGLNFPVVSDPGIALGAFYNTDNAPMTMIVDAETMEILYLSTGFRASDVDAILESRLQ